MKNNAFRLIACICLFAFRALATTYYVDINSTNATPPYTNWTTAATDIQSAVNQTTNGDLVLVNPGVYQSGGLLVSSPSSTSYYSVILTNAISLQSANGPTTTFIQCPAVGVGGSGMLINSSVFMTNGSVLNGFTLTTNGTVADLGGCCGVIATSPGAIITNCILTGFSYGGAHSGTLYDCIVTGNTGGGAIESTMLNCIISNNIAENGGGVSGGNLTNCVIVNNTAYENGGGVLGQAGYPVVLNNCLISNNIAEVGGGVFNYVVETPFGLHVVYTNCILDNCIVTSNSAVITGGGAFCGQLNNCLMSSNYVTGEASGNFTPGGGGMESGSAYNCTLIGNHVTGPQGMNGGGADGTYFSRYTVLSNCVLIANSAPHGGGANNCTLIHCTLLQNSLSEPEQRSVGIMGGGAAFSTLNDCLVISNQSAAVPFAYAGGGGAYACNLTNCLLAYNTIITNGGGANNSTLVNCTVIANTSANGGGVLNCTNYNSILYYNSGGDYYPATTQYPLNYCCTTLAPTNGFRNITNAPLFVNFAGGDYHLQPSSPCINSGNNAYISSATTDLDGNPRIVGGTVDIGAYEYQTPTSVISYAYLQQYGLPTDGSADFADLDGTAFNVDQDWIAGLNPTNPASVLAMLTPVTTNAANGVTVTWQSVSGVPYFLQRSTNLASQPPFSTIQNNITGQTNTTSYTDTSATNNAPYFYRVGVVTP
jgi:hypothetical protein